MRPHMPHAVNVENETFSTAEDSLYGETVSVADLKRKATSYANFRAESVPYLAKAMRIFVMFVDTKITGLVMALLKLSCKRMFSN